MSVEKHILQIALELGLDKKNVKAVAELLEGGATVPFISRYRKEVTGSMDEVAVTAVRDRLEQLAELDKRREAIVKSLEERELLSDELKSLVDGAKTLTELEDIYLPYRPKRRTRATIAKEKGLEPLSEFILEHQKIVAADPEAKAEEFVDEAKGVENAADALAGARDIIAERVNENKTVREQLRELFLTAGQFASTVLKGKEEEGAKFKDYFDWCEQLSEIPSHRALAMFRGEKERCLLLRVQVPEDNALAILFDVFVSGNTACSEQVRLAATDAYKRLLGPSIETEIRFEIKQRADEEAIRVFASNLRELLLASPLGKKRVLALDPGFRTGCKLVCLDEQGKLLFNTAIYPHSGAGGRQEAERVLCAACEKFKIQVVAIGNGTASRETEAFVKQTPVGGGLTIVMVNEAGASVYSASKVAREEFPDHDLTVRGAVSIGRRLMDPLAELVKIDPKSIGVGQYQHDVDQSALKKSLDDVVLSCVNGVGVDVNTASKQLLTYVSGLGPQIATNIVAYRDENGPFKTRKQLLKVSKLGPKAFEQAAGFLRIPGAANPLDSSAVHPESYHIVDSMASDLGCDVAKLVADKTTQKSIRIKDYVTETIGLPTLEDIVEELARPGRDPREKFEVFSFAEGVEKMEDLVVGQKIPGIVTNVTAFGAFVDIGVHQDGLVHISQLADRFVEDPAQVVKVQQKVMVTVVDVDIKRKRIALSMKSNPKFAKA